MLSLYLIPVLGHGCNEVSVSDPDSDWIRIQECKMTHKNRKKLINFMFWSAACFILRGLLMWLGRPLWSGGQGIVGWNFWSKNIKFIFSCKFFPNFGYQKPWSRLDPYPDQYLKCWIRNQLIGSETLTSVHVKSAISSGFSASSPRLVPGNWFIQTSVLSYLQFPSEYGVTYTNCFLNELVPIFAIFVVQKHLDWRFLGRFVSEFLALIINKNTTRSLDSPRSCKNILESNTLFSAW